MAKLAFSTDTRYDAGLSQGVVYPHGGAPAPWNGLVSATEKEIGGGLESDSYDGSPYYVDDANYSEGVTISCLTIPKALRSCLGTLLFRRGLYLTGQPKTVFDLSYRIEQEDGNYEYEIWYNLTAGAPSITRSTQADSFSPSAVQIEAKGVPVYDAAMKPAQYVRDVLYAPQMYWYRFRASTRELTPAKMALVENWLHGTDTTNPRIFLPSEVLL